MKQRPLARKVANVLLGLAATGGFVGALKISISHIATGFECPKLLFLPACFLVLAAYVLIFVSAIRANLRSDWLFWIGWVVVFGFAVTGSSLEIFGNNACPRSYGNIPACYYSLGLATMCLALHLIRRPHPDLGS